MFASCLTHLILLDSIVLLIYVEAEGSWNFSLYTFLFSFSILDR
jgi:hypothetical protein